MPLLLRPVRVGLPHRAAPYPLLRPRGGGRQAGRPRLLPPRRETGPRGQRLQHVLVLSTGHLLLRARPALGGPGLGQQHLGLLPGGACVRQGVPGCVGVGLSQQRVVAVLRRGFAEGNLGGGRTGSGAEGWGRKEIRKLSLLFASLLPFSLFPPCLGVGDTLLHAVGEFCSVKRGRREGKSHFVNSRTISSYALTPFPFRD